MISYDEWLQQGYQAGFCGPSVCITHDGMPTTEDEDASMDEGLDHCAHILRLYEDAEMKQAVEANHPPSKWRASNAGLQGFHRSIFMLDFEVNAKVNGGQKSWTPEQCQAWDDFINATEALADSFTPARIRALNGFQGSRTRYDD